MADKKKKKKALPPPPPLVPPSSLVEKSEDLMEAMIKQKSIYERQLELFQRGFVPVFEKYAQRITTLVDEYLDEFEQIVTESTSNESIPESLCNTLIMSEKERCAASMQLLFPSHTVPALATLKQFQFDSLAFFENEAKIIRTQALARGALARLRYSTLLSKFKRRNKTVKELLLTERSYVAGLRFLNNEVIARVQEQRLLNNDQVKRIFSNLPSLLNLHEDLLEKLEQRLASYQPHETLIADIFSSLVPFFKLYVEFVNNYEIAISSLIDARSTAANFLSFQEQLEERSGQQVSSLLITPVQRIPRYRMLLEQVCSLSEYLKHPDAAALKAVVEEIGSIANLLNEKKRLAENRNQMLAFAQSLKQRVHARGDDNDEYHPVVSIIAPHRKMLAQGRLSMVKSTRAKPVLVTLCNDVLFISSIAEKSSFAFSSNRSSSLLYKIRLSRVTSVVSSKMAASSLHLKFGHGMKKQLDLFALSGTPSSASHLSDDTVQRLESVGTWETAINGAVERLMEQRKTLKDDGLDSSEYDLSEVEREKERDKMRDRVSVSTIAGPPSERSVAISSAASEAILANSADSTARHSYVRRGKLRDLIPVYESALSLCSSLFQLPIDLGTLLPAALKSMNPQVLSAIQGRIKLLRRRMQELDAQYDRVTWLLRDEKLALDLQKLLLTEGVPAFALLKRRWQQRAANDDNEQALEEAIVDVFQFFMHLCQHWQRLLELPAH